MGIHASKAKSLRDSYDGLQNQMSELAKDRKEEADLITFVNQMMKQCDDIKEKMETAIHGMTELSGLFSEQADCYDKISVSLDRMKTSVDLNALASRKAYIEYHMKSCVTKLKEVSHSTRVLIDFYLHPIS